MVYKVVISANTNRKSKGAIPNGIAPQTVDKAGCETRVSQPIFLFYVMLLQIILKMG